MKKILAMLMAVCLVLALCACGSGGNTSAPGTAASGSKLTMGTGGEAGTYYAFGGVVGG